MRIITDKDRTAVAKAFLRFMAGLDGRRSTSKTYQKLTDRAIDFGISLDIIFNKANYDRVVELTPGVNAEVYIDALIDRRINAVPLTKEPEWDSDERGFGLVAEAFHEFFCEICPIGGTWNTPNARRNLVKAISRFGLQPILSEALITSSFGEDGSITCFNYVVALVKNEALTVETGPTEYEETREQEDAACAEDDGCQCASDEDKNPFTNFDGMPPAGLRIDNRVDEETYNRAVVATSGRESDEPLPEDEAGGCPDAPCETPEPHEEWPDETECGHQVTFVGMRDNPRDTKRYCVMCALMGLAPSALSEFAEIAPDVESVDAFIDRLTDGDVDFSLETPTMKMTHQTINSDLVEPFVHCVQMQGSDMDESRAVEFDILATGWDLRDEKTRILQKVRKMIADTDPEDNDLKKALRYLEEM